MGGEPYCSVVIPCYGSARTVEPLMERLDKVFGELGVSYEAIFVNDASPDDLSVVLERLWRAWPGRVVVIELMANAGQHTAILAGLRRVRGRVVITMDDDLQNPPEEIPRLLEGLGPEVDVVVGVPGSKRHPYWRNVGSRSVRRLCEVTIGKPKGLALSSFRLLRREVADAMALSQSPFLFLDAELFRVTRRVRNVDVEHHERAQGRSGYTLGRLVRLTGNLVFNHSSLPLRMISILGILTALFALCLGIWVIVRVMLGYPQQVGWPSLAVLISFLGGAILFSLGMIGEYLIRIIHQTVNRPQYHVRTIRPAGEEGAELPEGHGERAWKGQQKIGVDSGRTGGFHGV